MALFGAAGSSGGDIRPIVKWDARAGKFFLVERVQGVGGWETVQNEVEGPTFLVDMDSLEIGFVAFNPAPDFRLVLQSDAESGAASYPEQPSADHRPTFRVNIKMKADQAPNDPLRSFGSQAVSVRGSFSDLHTAYEAAKGEHEGEMPVVRISGSTAIKSSANGSTNYAPNFEILAWQTVPEDVTAARPESTALPFETPANTPPPTLGTTTTAPPVAEADPHDLPFDNPSPAPAAGAPSTVVI